MQKYNVLVVFDHDKSHLLMCKRKKQPYKNLYNLVGGKIELGENGYDAAYRELFEETGISAREIKLTHLMDFTYYISSIVLEVYVGILNQTVDVKGDENDLCWLDSSFNYFDMSMFAGEGNIGHILEQVKIYEGNLLVL